MQKLSYCLSVLQRDTFPVTVEGHFANNPNNIRKSYFHLINRAIFVKTEH